ncbi:complement component receptor 1-like protein isoform X2 [Bufo gargarizans]|uniref:complement component receptor 1-like protein isoform X2 n=1 Tax=Bufo gargarizans TaxID=30331 RepID=UPI001CF2022C|nr:complement component receptor 1-like protein isoform X2 [Bufo gargarizans]
MLPVPYIFRRTWAIFLIFHSQLICIRGDCGPPPVIEHTQPVAETSGVPGATVAYKCDRSTGYYEIPNETRTITCQDDGTWSSVSTFCTRACGVPNRLQYAVPRDSDLEKDIFSPGTIVRYDCRDGYRRVSQTINSVTCLANYTWSEPSVFCERKSCGNPGDIENGDFEATDGFLFGSRVTYTCYTGYQTLSRRNYRDCQADGTWSNDRPQCEAVICAPPESPADGTYNPTKEEYSYLDAVTFTCNKGFHIDGEATASCTSDGTWSTAPPNCKAVNCQDPGQVEHARKTFGFVGPYTLNSNVGYECESSFVLNGSSSIICNINSQWEPGIPKCLIPCKVPSVSNSRPIVGLNRVYVQDDAVRFECEAGFVLNGSPLITCSSRGQWEPSPPKCDATCTFPEVVNAQPKMGLKAFYVQHDVLVIECKEDFVLSGSGTIRCSSQGQWEPPPPECRKKATCTFPEVANAQPKMGLKAFYVQHEVLVIECKEDFVLSGSGTIRCSSQGQWEPPPPECMKKDDGSGGGLSNGVIAGIVIACLVVVAIVITLCCCCCLKQKSGKPKSDTPDVHYSACNDA